MTRRQAISILMTSAPALCSGTQRLDRVLDPREGCALLIDIRTRDVVASNHSPLSATMLAPPGSALKPFTLVALLAINKLRLDAEFICPQKLTLGGHRLDCSHPRVLAPIRIETALAYSCNCYVAHFAARFAPGELARGLLPFGLVAPSQSGELQQLQALGLADILITPESLALAYRQLALQTARPAFAEVLSGLQGAVDYGTAQLAAVKWTKLAGKTGSARLGPQFLAWFAGFFPAHAPETAILVMLSGRHGGSDAAPVAAQILDAWHSSHS
jgi:cell division protein FtsI/penicillin-binding protein 2